MPNENLSQKAERFADDARDVAHGNFNDISSQTKKDVVEAIGNAVIDHQENQRLGLKNTVSAPVSENITVKVGQTNDNQPFIGIKFGTGVSN